MPTQTTPVIFAVGFASALLLVAIIKAFKKRDRESEIEFLQFERDHREQLRDSKIHRDRVARRSIFSALFFLGVLFVFTLAVPTLGFHNSMQLVEDGDFEKISVLKTIFQSFALKVILWVIYAIYVFVLRMKYVNLNAHQKFLYKIDEKMVKAGKRKSS